MIFVAEYLAAGELYSSKAITGLWTWVKDASTRVGQNSDGAYYQATYGIRCLHQNGAVHHNLKTSHQIPWSGDARLNFNGIHNMFAPKRQMLA